MSGLQDLVSGGAECSTSNPMAGFMKHFQKDRSLEQDRMRPMETGPMAGKQAFRSAHGKQPMMADEFLLNEPQQTGPSGRAFDFHAMHRQLDQLPDLPAVAGPSHVPHMAAADWAADFALQHPSRAGPVGLAEFDIVFQGHQRTGPGPAPADWAHEYHQLHSSAPVSAAPGVDHFDAGTRTAFDQAFAHAEQSIHPAAPATTDHDWAVQFDAAHEVSHIPTMIVSESVEAAEQARSETAAEVLSTQEDPAAIAAAARELLDSVADSDNPKFQNSQFMNLMKKLRDKEAIIENDTVVERTGEAWADEFTRVEPASSVGERAAGNMWSQEFATRLEKDWTEDLADGEAGKSSNWAAQFADDAEFRELEAAFNDGRTTEEWVSEYRKNIAPLSTEPADEEWEAMAKRWEEQAPVVGMGYHADAEAYQTYTFEANNPYLTRPSLTDAEIGQLDLGEAILALEARVQRDTQDAAAWYKLGVRQQENEQDGLAITALRKAVSTDPELHNAWIDLAVSYTNENCRADAYDALEAWITANPKYQGLAEDPAARALAGDSRRKHQYIEQLFLSAARQGLASSGGQPDADVQVALGVLFHITEDYAKATDCFQTALNLRPQEYLLWNKLGATLANARQPQRAMDAYFTALELNPSYVRARYNLAISSINLGLHREAAEHLLGALALQTRGGQQTSPRPGNADGKRPAADDVGSRISSNLWSTLKMTMQIMDHTELAAACDQHDLGAFHGQFDF
ncbi:hypothetical protein IWQ60_001388 [Tieghemiomyces parasiticus]|uniref:Peroxisomal targeting signal receptor n=1 Tax=Tieghemiomyces parasiticus TaxID=78921 RepID=A0A9W8DWN7_9FUNG|nr:hypothetical protein IWQ60_001388 [Tieghemiomyces parasiticus]